MSWTRLAKRGVFVTNNLLQVGLTVLAFHPEIMTKDTDQQQFIQNLFIGQAILDAKSLILNTCMGSRNGIIQFSEGLRGLKWIGIGVSKFFHPDSHQTIIGSALASQALEFFSGVGLERGSKQETSSTSISQPLLTRVTKKDNNYQHPKYSDVSGDRDKEESGVFRMNSLV